MAPVRAGRTRTMAANERMNISDRVLEGKALKDEVW